MNKNKYKFKHIFQWSSEGHLRLGFLDWLFCCPEWEMHRKRGWGKCARGQFIIHHTQIIFCILHQNIK